MVEVKVLGRTENHILVHVWGLKGSRASVVRLGYTIVGRGHGIRPLVVHVRAMLLVLVCNGLLRVHGRVICGIVRIMPKSLIQGQLSSTLWLSLSRVFTVVLAGLRTYGLGLLSELVSLWHAVK